MAPSKDMRRPELVVPYVKPDDKEDTDMSSTMSTTMPMIAMFTRNRMIGWTAVIFAIQAWLAETADAKAKASQPAYIGVGMSIMGVGMAYLPLFLPPPPVRTAAPTGTEAPAAAPMAWLNKLFT